MSTSKSPAWAPRAAIAATTASMVRDAGTSLACAGVASRMRCASLRAAVASARAEASLDPRTPAEMLPSSAGMSSTSTRVEPTNGAQDDPEAQGLPPALAQVAGQGTDPAEHQGGPARYPTPRTVTMTSGFSGSISTFPRRRCTWTLTSRVSPACW